MNDFKRWLRDRLAHVDRIAGQDEVAENQYDDLRGIVSEAERRAATLGLVEALSACQAVHCGPVSTGIVRSVLGQCLAACPPDPKPDLLSVVAVAAMLDVSPSHVRRLVDGGRLPKPIKVGNLLRWSTVELQTWINQHGHRLSKAKR
ncbi:MAG: helix-turn-helix domain-containing protein [Planctomycetia bacterium]|nr:helix-turn-helix domain-containing protein [Planctomycetia bacterium]